jgi:hypothetical protein
MNTLVIAGGIILAIAIGGVALLDYVMKDNSSSSSGSGVKSSLKSAWAKITGCDDDKEFFEDCD